MTPVYTARLGQNADLFPDVLRLYAPANCVLLDCTFGTGAFWRKVVRPDISRVTLDLLERADVRGDFRALPFRDSTYDVVIFDPPYAMGGYNTRMKSYQLNHQRRLVKDIQQLYRSGMSELHRVLKPQGTAIIKCQDQMASGKQRWVHNDVMTASGFRPIDLFVLVTKNPPLRHRTQQSARKNHSFFCILKKI